MQIYILIIFMWMFSYYLLYFADNFQKIDNFKQSCWFFEIDWRNTTASTKTFTEKNKLGHNSALHIFSYLSMALSKILPHSKAIRNSKKYLVFGENYSRRLSIFLQTHIFWTHIFWTFDHISRIYNQINNYMNIWFPKVIINLIITAQVLFFNVLPENHRTLMRLRNS